MGTGQKHGGNITVASKTVEKGSPEWQAFMDIWDIYKQTAEPESDEKYWHDLVWEHANGYLEKYKNIPEYPIFRNMIIGMCNGLDEMAKERGM